MRGLSDAGRAIASHGGTDCRRVPLEGQGRTPGAGLQPAFAHFPTTTFCAKRRIRVPGGMLRSRFRILPPIWAAGLPPASHEAKLTFRLAVPVLARTLHLGRDGMLALFALCGVFTLYLTLDLSFRITQNRIAAAAVCLGVACVWPGVLAFHQLLGGFYDAVALCLVLAAMWAPAPLAAIGLLAAAWTDERALLAGLLVMVYAGLRREPGAAHRDRSRRRGVRGNAVLVRQRLFAAHGHGWRRPRDLPEGVQHGAARHLDGARGLLADCRPAVCGCW